MNSAITYDGIGKYRSILQPLRTGIYKLRLINYLGASNVKCVDGLVVFIALRRITTNKISSPTKTMEFFQFNPCLEKFVMRDRKIDNCKTEFEHDLRNVIKNAFWIGT